MSEILFKFYKMKINIKYIILLVVIQFICGILYLLLSLFNLPNIMAILYIIILSIPFILLVLIITNTDIFKTLYSEYWFKFTLFVLSYFYIIFANSYASNVINSSFKIDSDYFTNTKLLLTVVFALVPMQYFTLFLLFILSIIHKDIIKERLYFIFFSIIYILFMSLFLIRSEWNIKNSWIDIMVLELDFNKYNACSNLKYIRNLYGVIYLHNNNVLISYITNEEKSPIKYKIDICDFKAKIEKEQK